MSLKEEIEDLKEAAESNMMDGDHSAIENNLYEALEIIQQLSWLCEGAHIYLDEVEE